MFPDIPDLRRQFGASTAVDRALRWQEPCEEDQAAPAQDAEFGLTHLKMYGDIARHREIATAHVYPVRVGGRYVVDPSPIPKLYNSELSNGPALQLFWVGREQRIHALPPFTQAMSLDFEDHPFRARKADHFSELCGATESPLDGVIVNDARGRMSVCSDTDHYRERRGASAGGCAGWMWRRCVFSWKKQAGPLLQLRGLSKFYGVWIGCAEVSFGLYPGEVPGIVGESGSGKSTRLSCAAGLLACDAGEVILDTQAAPRDVLGLSAAGRRMLARSDWTFVHQNPSNGLRMGVSAGGNVGERLMGIGARHYGAIRARAADWLGRVEIAADRIDDRPSAFRAGCSRA